MAATNEFKGYELSKLMTDNMQPVQLHNYCAFRPISAEWKSTSSVSEDFNASNVSFFVWSFSLLMKNRFISAKIPFHSAKIICYGDDDGYGNEKNRDGDAAAAFCVVPRALATIWQRSHQILISFPISRAFDPYQYFLILYCTCARVSIKTLWHIHATHACKICVSRLQSKQKVHTGCSWCEWDNGKLQNRIE